jgi:hypothetical protein
VNGENFRWPTAFSISTIISTSTALLEVTLAFSGSEKNPRAQLAPICHQKCLSTGHISALGCLSRLARTSKKAAKYRIDSVACRCS